MLKCKGEDKECKSEVQHNNPKKVAKMSPVELQSGVMAHVWVCNGEKK
jgi:hypothetical protein